MATIHSLLSNFTAGELSPRLYGRVDLAKYANGARAVNNMITLPQGGARRRGGSRYVAQVKDNEASARLVEFTFSTTQSYMLEFGDFYIRFFRNRGAIYDQQKSISAINSSTGDITVIGHSFVVGDRVVVTNADGMHHLNNIEVEVSNSSPDVIKVSGASFSADTYVPTSGEVSRIYELVTNYSAADVADLTFTQSADTLYIFSDAWPMTQLTRTGHAAWTIAAAALEDGPFLDLNTDETNTVSVDIAAGDGGVMTFSEDTLHTGHEGALFRIWEKANGSTFGYATWAPGASVTVADGSFWEYKGNVYYVVSGGSATMASTASYPTHTKGTVSVFYGSGGESAEMRFEHSGFAVVQITDVLDTKNAMVNVLGDNRVPYTAYGARSSPQWQEGAWSDYRGYPRCGTFHEQRLVTAGNAYRPSTFWGSKTGEYLNFKDGDKDKDAYIYTIASDQADAIRYVASAKRLALLTSSSEYVASASSADQAITPTNVKVSRETNHGTANVRPIRAGPAILVAQRAGDNTNPSRKVRELVYQFQTDSFVAPDLTILADHITYPGVTSGAFTGSPDLIVWYAKADGTFIGMTYERDQQVVGWHRHALGNSGEVRCLAAIPGQDIDELWAINKYVIDGDDRYYVEWVQHGLKDDQELEDAQFLDCSLMYDGDPVTNVYGLSHLNGETVDALVDGKPVYDLAVADGGVTLPYEGSKVTVGFNYTSQLKTLHIEAGAQSGTAQGRLGRVYEVILRMLRSVGGEVGQDGKEFDQIPYRTTDIPLAEAIPLYSGDVVLPFDGDWDRDRYVTVETSEPLPLQITCMMLSQRVSG